MKRLSAFRAALLLAASLIPPLAAHAQTPPTSPGERDLIQERQRRLLDDQRQRLDDLRRIRLKDAPLWACCAKTDAKERYFD